MIHYNASAFLQLTQ